ncbi:MAG: hypothetical protein U9N34_05640, partial [Candidatus Cloacimonadota bacterium]|nr:hypothetical protein [Candidatus Cloacimonadota bacterium]
SILDDRRLSRSISIVISDKEISVISDLTGEKISNLVEEKTLVSVSSYDSIEKSLYFVNLDGLLKVNLKIR